MSRPIVYWFYGLPASGKSTESMKISAQDSEAIRVNKDTIREMLSVSGNNIRKKLSYEAMYKMMYQSLSENNSRKKNVTEIVEKLWTHYESKNNFTKVADAYKKKRVPERVTVEIQNKVIAHFVGKRKNIIVDDTNYNPSHLARVRGLCEGYEFKFFDMHKDFGVTVEECIKRNRKRNKDIDSGKVQKDKVPDIAIYGMAKQYGIGSYASSGVEYSIYETDNDKVVIVDIDGTLANIDHRIHFLNKDNSEKPNWEGFFSCMDRDSFRENIWAIVTDCYFDADVVIVTGRPDSHKEVTEKWLKDQGVDYKAIYMRRSNDRRGDTVVKQEILDSYLPKEKIVGVLDDRKSVIDMWRSNGLIVTNCGGPNNDF